MSLNPDGERPSRGYSASVSWYEINTKPEINNRPPHSASWGSIVEDVVNLGDGESEDKSGFTHKDNLKISVIPPGKDAGTYETKCSVGAYSKLTVLGEVEAHDSRRLFSVRANGPKASLGVHAGIGTWAAVEANAELFRVEGNFGPFSGAVCPNVNTGASVGLDGLEASFLGMGVHVGPTLGVKTPVGEVSVPCSIM